MLATNLEKLDNHKMIAEAMTPHVGEELSRAKIREYVLKKFPNFSEGSVLPNDHSNIGNEHPCWCARRNERIFDQIKRNLYRVLPSRVSLESAVSVELSTDLLLTPSAVKSIDEETETDLVAAIETETLTDDAQTAEDTEIQRLVWLRKNQSKFSNPVRRFWKGRCAVTNIEAESILQACHIKPFSESNDTERLDEYNGLCLSAHIHSAFDAHLIGFAPSGEIRYSSRLSKEDRRRMGLNRVTKIALSDRHRPYIEHRYARFLAANASATSGVRDLEPST